MKLKNYFGPSTLVTAAFIGPGTLTVCTIAGAEHGYTLLWVLLFATIATIILQEMAARLGLITQKGLGEAIRLQLSHPIGRWFSFILIFIAIIIGNAAYEAGNISGAVLGLTGILGSSSAWALIIGLIAFVILFFGKFYIIERILIVLLLIMNVVFLVTAIIVKPDLTKIFYGFLPSIHPANQLSVLALIGTTVVPYNLFLHASTISKKWKSTRELGDLRKENAIAITLGGFISMAIVITSASSLFGVNVKGVDEMASQLEPLLGTWAKYFLAIGLFAAGISSAITAPLAAAFTAKGIFGWELEKNIKFRSVWIMVLACGVIFSTLGYQPITVIQLAQIANGLLLPIVVVFLMYIVNKKSLMKEYVNKTWQNILGVIVVMISLIISFRSLNSVFSFIS